MLNYVKTTGVTFIIKLYDEREKMGCWMDILLV